MKQLLLLLCISVFLNSVCAQVKPPAEILTNTSVMEMHKAGLDDDIIISKISGSQGNFDLSTTKLIELKKAGISSTIVKALMDKTNNSSVVSVKTSIEAPVGNITAIDMLNYPYLETGQGNYKPIEKAVATVSTKRHMLGYGGTDIIYQIPSENSTTRIKSRDGVSFLVNTGGSTMPEFVLYKLKIENKGRNVVGLQTKVFGPAVKAVDNVVTYNTVVVKSGVYKITIPTTLKSGEYFFSIKNINSLTTTDVFAFGVD
ncbi:MAG TPA: hypothetical protein VGC01_07590 [Mucilaginibacter sp.]